MHHGILCRWRNSLDWKMAAALLDIRKNCQDIRKTVVLNLCATPHTCLEPGDKMILIIKNEINSLNNDD